MKKLILIITLISSPASACIHYGCDYGHYGRHYNEDQYQSPPGGTNEDYKDEDGFTKHCNRWCQGNTCTVTCR
jgi:hypothetical protein